ncbi:MAG TPA: cobalt transporter [Stenomitos sp.]
MMKPIWIISPILAGILATSIPMPLLAHVGHGDEFQAQGGINRVQVNPATDPMLGITVSPIKQAAADGAGVMIPVTALVDANGKQLVFVQYEKFYEPVPVTTGATQGDLIQVTNGLSVGEKLVTQGSLSLYAESRKTQTAESSPSADASPATSPQTNEAHAKADAQGVPHSHDAAGNLVAQRPSEATQQSKGFPMGIAAAAAGGVVLLIGAIAVLNGGRKKKSTFPDEKEGF